MNIVGVALIYIAFLGTGAYLIVNGHEVIGCILAFSTLFLEYKHHDDKDKPS